jgi:hypothetical protein
MILYEFNMLDINNKMETVNQYATFLDNTNKEDRSFKSRRHLEKYAPKF